jgi:flagellar basal-body rod modification protein FlgD
MDITGITNSSAGNKTTSTAPIKTLGKDEFLRLLTTQLKAQNPLNPMDSTGFTAQLAQFSSLEQLTNINTGLTNMLSSQNSLQNTMTAGLLGKKVKADGNALTLANGQATMPFSLLGDAAKVTVSIYDANGTLVKQQDVGAQNAGEHAAVWDGRDKNGMSLAAGQYTFSVDAVNGAGKSVSASTLLFGTVTGISFENGKTYLSINNGTTKIQLGDIREIGG